MNGKIIKLDNMTSTGLIRNEDNIIYEFTFSEVMSNQPIKTGLYIDFEVFEHNQARSIYILDVSYDPIEFSKRLLLASKVFIKESDHKLARLFFSGCHSNVLCVITVMTLLSMWLPIIELSDFMTFKVASGFFGYCIHFLFLIIFFAFYGGVSRKYILIFAAIISGCLSYRYYDILTHYNNFQTGFAMGGVERRYELMEIIQPGLYVNIAMIALFICSACLIKYKKNKKTY